MDEQRGGGARGRRNLGSWAVGPGAVSAAISSQLLGVCAVVQIWALVWPCLVETFRPVCGRALCEKLGWCRTCRHGVVPIRRLGGPQ
eukprot:5364247-Prorocentrum_lima.AAC.1